MRLITPRPHCCEANTAGTEALTAQTAASTALSDIATTHAGALFAANNLSDVASVTSARLNLG